MATLVGTWVTSYTGWMHFYPPDEPDRDGSETYDQFMARENELPPLIGGQRVIPGFATIAPVADIYNDPRFPDTYEAREGYFIIAGVISLNLAADNSLTGFEQFNRGAMRWKLNKFESGSWGTERDAQTQIDVRTIRTRHRNFGGLLVENVYTYVVRNDDELDWVARTSFEVGRDERDDLQRYLPRVAHGTFRRVSTTIT
jgi:hypothetical protein